MGCYPPGFMNISLHEGYSSLEMTCLLGLEQRPRGKEIRMAFLTLVPPFPYLQNGNPGPSLTELRELNKMVLWFGYRMY
jgi:hypothetical protein